MLHENNFFYNLYMYILHKVTSQTCILFYQFISYPSRGIENVGEPIILHVDTIHCPIAPFITKSLGKSYVCMY